MEYKIKGSKVRQINYAAALCEACAQLLRKDSSVFVIGQGLWNPWYVGTSMKDIDREFGRHRIIDTPVSEDATTGLAIGAAIVGMRPIVVHPRMDFMLLAVSTIVNQASNWSYMFNGKSNVPIVIRPIINRGGEQGAQHSQAMHTWFAHVPGIKVVMPSTPYDAKGLFISSVYDGNPVIFIDDRWLYDEIGDVPKEMYRVPIGKGSIVRQGKDVTIVTVSYMRLLAEKAAIKLASLGIDAEIIDLRSIKPFDEDIISKSLKKTGRLVVADTSWLTCGFSAEIAAFAASRCFKNLKAPVARITLPDVPAPTSSSLEKVYYPTENDIVKAVKDLFNKP